jgi:DNA-binding transcriptional LysR family regulator
VDVRFVGNEELKVSLDKYALDCAITYDDYEAQMSWCNAQPIFKETWSLLVPDSFEFENMEDISWNEAAKLPFAMLSPSMHERQLVDSIFRGLGFEVTPKIESESILHLMFQTQYTELCTIIPTHFTRMPGMLTGTKALLLKEPVIEKGVSLFWVKTDNVMPMPSIAEKIAKSLAETGEMQNYLY